MKQYLLACPDCGGDLHDDPENEEKVVCFLCAHIFEKKDVPAISGKQTRPKQEPKGPQQRPRRSRPHAPRMQLRVKPTPRQPREKKKEE